MGIETVQIDAVGFSFTADVAGPANGDLVLLLHGFPQSRYTWRHELLALADAGYHACAPDQRGYSPGARPNGIEAYVVENLVGDVIAIANALGASRFHLVGHDWGGGVAWSVAARHPQSIRTLSIISRPHPRAFARGMKNDERQASRSSHHRSFQRAEATTEMIADDAARLRSIFEHAHVPVADAASYIETLNSFEAMDAAINWYRALGRSDALKGDVPPASMPTLYVWGNADRAVGRLAAELTGEYVDAPYEFVELDDVGHFVTDEQPEAFPTLLLSHLARYA